MCPVRRQAGRREWHSPVGRGLVQKWGQVEELPARTAVMGRGRHGELVLLLAIASRVMLLVVPA